MHLRCNTQQIHVKFVHLDNAAGIEILGRHLANLHGNSFFNRALRNQDQRAEILHRISQVCPGRSGISMFIQAEIRFFSIVKAGQSNRMMQNMPEVHNPATGFPSVQDGLPDITIYLSDLKKVDDFKGKRSAATMTISPLSQYRFCNNIGIFGNFPHRFVRKKGVRVDLFKLVQGEPADHLPGNSFCFTTFSGVDQDVPHPDVHDHGLHQFLICEAIKGSI